MELKPLRYQLSLKGAPWITVPDHGGGRKTAVHHYGAEGAKGYGTVDTGQGPLAREHEIYRLIGGRHDGDTVRVRAAYESE